MLFKITEDILSITDLKKRTNSILKQIHQTKRPIILTVNGKAEAVLLDAMEYEKITTAFDEMQKMISEGSGLEAEKRERAVSIFKRLRKKKDE
ncbi:MAG: type II toxin-antitoxin system Phd/YefM family antitoxin [Candidatus Cloacimonetes bacterium]|nr:type II toxin-antitoxin system Phd/YefM family antitoxin [Candidatus Cloacimonadota bacterium]